MPTGASTRSPVSLAGWGILMPSTGPTSFVRRGEVAGLLLVGHQNLRDGTIQRTILEFGDLYVQPKYRDQGIATEVIRQTILATDHPWLVYVFRDDVRALAFWDRAFKRLPFSSVREVVPPDVPEFVEFVVNDAARPPPV